MKISNYDEYKYDYKTYWNNREYENEAERIYLKKAFRNTKGRWFIDIGGSFGRNLDLYYSKYSNPVIVDYSILTLQNNYKEITSKYPHTVLIAANAYHLPFKPNSFDGGLMVRVLHHIEKSSEYFKEVSQILGKGSVYIQEFANKFHIKATLRSLLKGKLSYFNHEPYQQPAGNFEGTKGEATTFLNYSPRYIKDNLEANNLKIVSQQGVSFLRVPIAKQIIPTKALLSLERILQTISKGIYFTPSVFFKAVSRKTEYNKYDTLYEILACPKCKSSLKIKNETAKCDKCRNAYRKENNIWDFRI